jgi:fluoroquinolone transport system permease protein
MKRIIGALVTVDLKNIMRDQILLMSAVGPLLAALAFRIILPEFRNYVIEYVDLSEYYPVVMAFVTILAPSMVGALTGFMILDDRDSRLLEYFAVTPLRRTGYLVWKLASPVLLSVIITIAALQLAALTPIVWPHMLGIILLAACQAPFMTLFLGALASNKVEGLALYKLSGLFFTGPFIAWFVPMPWQYAGGVLPTYWVGKALFMLHGTAQRPVFPHFALWLAGGWIVTGISIWLMLRIFDRKVL